MSFTPDGYEKVFPELDYLVHIFRSEFEPKNKQHE